MTDELAATQEELAAAKAELERIQEAAADSEARAAHAESQLTQANAEIELARNESETREQDLTAQLQSAADRYRGLALEQAPELPAELVSGATVAEVDEALQRARETVSKVRGHLESQAQAGKVPVGAPPRSEPDLSGLSTEEKISYGLQQRAG
ncbi:MAG: hypothetical protein J4N98_00350 [Chloroflexi bacterium]|nr:hypothetical protein [Chloroflexota bacterium]